MSEYFQRVSYFDVVVDFAVKYNSEIAIVGKNRLVSRIQVDNFKARRARREKTGLKDALLIRPPVNQRRGCLAYCSGGALQFLVVNPTIPHNSLYLAERRSF